MSVLPEWREHIPDAHLDPKQYITEITGPVSLRWERSERYPDEPPETAVWSIPVGASLWIRYFAHTDEGYDAWDVDIGNDGEECLARFESVGKDCDGTLTRRVTYRWNPETLRWDSERETRRDSYAEAMGY